MEKGNPAAPLLIIGENKNNLNKIEEELKKVGLNNTRIIYNMKKAAEIVGYMSDISCIIIDANSKDLNVHDIVKEIRDIWGWDGIVVINAEDDEQFFDDGAFLSIKEGYSSKTLIQSIYKTMTHKSNAQSNTELADIIKTPKSKEELTSFEKFVTNSKELLGIFNYTRIAAKKDEPILITGETGTGKTNIAEAIHLESGRSGSFEVFNPAEFENDDLIVKTLFGFVQANKISRGIAERIENGTLAIKNIDKTSNRFQNILYRAISQKEYFPYGSSNTLFVTFRIIATSSEDIKELVDANKFDKSLYYKLRTYEINLPPLRDRIEEDIVKLLDMYLEEFSKKHNKTGFAITKEMIDLLVSYSYPGNMREFLSMVELAVSRSENEEEILGNFKSFIKEENIDFCRDNDSSLVELLDKSATLPTINQITADLVRVALKRAKYKRSIASVYLGISVIKLEQIMKQLNIN